MTFNLNGQLNIKMSQNPNLIKKDFKALMSLPQNKILKGIFFPINVFLPPSLLFPNSP